MSKTITITFRLQVFSLESVKRAAYLFTGRFSFDIGIIGEEIICSATPLGGRDEVDVDAFRNQFRNVVLDQDLRETIASQTEAVRNVILAHAFSRTALQGE